MRNEFKTYHPIVNFVYFLFAIGFSCVFMHPAYLLLSLLSALSHLIMLKGAKTNILYMLFMGIGMMLLNPLFNHEGITVLLYFKSGNPLTLESLAYGAAAAIMVVSVICHFSCYNLIMTSDKFLYLFGRIIPSLSLVFSMTLRFVPLFTRQIKEAANARRLIGKGVSAGKVSKKAKNGVSILSAAVTHSLENAVDTSDSMKWRGYGAARRTAFSIFKFDKRDKAVLTFMLLLGAYTFWGAAMGETAFLYFPQISFESATLYSLSVFLSYALLCFMPVIIEIWEVRKWKAIKSKI